jgi:redox-sensitive bicupin YhaK (pirin superfamily)
MSTFRAMKRVFSGKPTIEGAGVRLKRAFGYHEVPLFDPFLLLDDFHSDNPADYLAGFPWHPHRGIETVTYVLHGSVRHGDSIGNSGVIQSGDVQWMTAGSGIIHQEMPEQANGNLLWGLQLWVNLPASHKMMPPRYRDVNNAQIPEVTLQDGVAIKIICGTVAGVKGPAQDIIADPEYLDVTVPAGMTFEYQVKDGYTVFAYILSGKGYFEQRKTQLIQPEQLVLFDKSGDTVATLTTDDAVRFLLISGKPIGEPVAWYGPIVMNTQAELQQAFEEYQNGTFIKQ